MALTTLIAEDEAPARSRLKRLLAPHIEAGTLTLAGEVSDGQQALERLKQPDIDLVFLDVQMPELTGFDVLEQLPPERDNLLVIFSTAYDEYAIQAFRANAVDYLLKPVNEDDLADAIDRAVNVRASGTMSEQLGRLLDAIDATQASATPKASETVRQLSVPHRDRLIVLNVDDLVSAEVQDGITRFVVLKEDLTGPPTLKKYIVSYTLEQLEQSLDSDQFVRVHRSAIVNMKHVREMIPWFSGRYKLILRGRHEVVASRERSKKLRSRLSL